MVRAGLTPSQQPGPGVIQGQQWGSPCSAEQMWRSRTPRLLLATRDILQNFSHPEPLPEQQQLRIVEESFPKITLLLKPQRGTHMGLEAGGRGKKGQ